MKNTFENIGIHVPEIMLPSKDVNLEKWSVVACDQYTSQHDYWNDVKNIVGNSPSTLNLIFPEIYLKDADKEDRIKNINSTMEKYIDSNIIETQNLGFILVERVTEHSGSRKGLVIAVDLEKYDYNKGSQTLIRATEGTVLDRIPPRVKIRENAKIELPHILLLIDDPEKTVIEKLFENTQKYEKVYDFELMKKGGHIKGWKVDDKESISSITSALQSLASPSFFNKKYNVSDDFGVLLFAAGDGNHSLATAKAHWENIKANQGLDSASNHPARFALVEVVNVHDLGIIFEPIHRVVFGIDSNKILDQIAAHGDILINFKTDEPSPCLQNEHKIPFILGDKRGTIEIKNSSFNLAVGALQSILDDLAKLDKEIEIDYIHGDDVVTDLGSKPGNIGFYLPAMNKHDLFKTVILEGALPRKTFSMGEAEEKRYYLECRKIK